MRKFAKTIKLNMMSEYESDEPKNNDSRGRSTINRKRHNEIDYKIAHYGDAHPNKKLKYETDLKENENEKINVPTTQSRSSLLLNKHDYSIDSIPYS